MCVQALMHCGRGRRFERPPEVIPACNVWSTICWLASLFTRSYIEIVEAGVGVWLENEIKRRELYANDLLG